MSNLLYCETEYVMQELVDKGMTFLKQEGDFYILSTNGVPCDEFAGEIYYTDEFCY